MSESQHVNQQIQRKAAPDPTFGQHPMESAGAENMRSLSPAPFQLKAGNNAAGGSGGDGNPGGLPGQLKENIEAMSGQDMSDVKVNYNSGKPAQMQALATAQGSEINLAPGQEKHLPHEAWHVAQQKEGRVQANTSVNGAPVNDDQGLEREADQMGEKAASSGPVQQKKASVSSGGSNAKAPVQRKVLSGDKEKEQFFKDYKATAEVVLARWYKTTKTKDGRDQLTADMFVNAAKKVYERKGDTKYVVPVEFAMSQARLEGGVSRHERLGQGNVFNVAAYDSGVSGAEKQINTLEKGFDAYYNFMADKMLDDKTPEQLLEPGNFTKGPNGTGGVYATNPVYEAEIKGEIGKMRMATDGFKLSGTVGIGGKNNPDDVKKVGALLVKAGYLNAKDAGDASKVGAAILSYQTKELVPQDSEWFKKRYAAVTNPIDKKNVDIKLKGFKDGVVSNSGHTLGCLYMKTASGGALTTETGSGRSDAKGTTKPETKPESKPESKPSTGGNTGGKTTGNSGSGSSSGGGWMDWLAETANDALETAGDAWDSVSDMAGNAYDTVSGWFGGSSGSTTSTAGRTTSSGSGASTTTPKTTTGGNTTTAPKANTTTPPKSISASVGKGGANKDADVRVIQALLIKAGVLAPLNSKGKSNIDGDCGNLTETAIYNFQKNKLGFSNPDSLVEVGGTTWKGLTGQPIPERRTNTSNTGGGTSGGTKTSETAKADVKARPELTAGGNILNQIQTNFPDGITVAIYANYAKTGNKSKDSNNAEFPRAASKYAQSFNAVGYDGGGQLKLGLAQPITNLTDVTNVINDIHKLLKAEHKKANPGAGDNFPAYTKIKRLALFSHGMPYGMHLADSGRYNLKNNSEDERKKLKEFVAGIRGALKDDVIVNLMACNAGRETDGTEKEGVWGLGAAEKQDGSSSFGASLAEELGKDSSVYAHLSAGHTVNNYSARVFGKDAGKDPTKDKGGVHIFNLLYDAAFIKAEAARLGKDEKAVKDKMWKHYTKRMSDSHQGKFSITNGDGKTEKVGLGAEMFSDISRAKEILRSDWKTWVTSNPV